jgi:hypothetical protein
VIVVVTNSIQPAFTGISSFFFVTDQNITLTIGLEHPAPQIAIAAARPQKLKNDLSF